MSIPFERQTTYNRADFMQEKPQPDDPNLDRGYLIYYLATGMRQPQNESEEKLLKEIQEIKDRGQCLEIPLDD